MYKWIRDVRYNFDEFVKADDEALRVLNRVRFELKIEYGFTAVMFAVREVLRGEGHDVPFRLGGYRRDKRDERERREEN